MSNTAIAQAAARPRLSLKIQTLAAAAAVVGAVAVPQLFHVMGAVSGLGTALGETFLPMHLPIILVGCWRVRGRGRFPAYWARSSAFCSPACRKPPCCPS